VKNKPKETILHTKQKANKQTITMVYSLCVIFMRFGVYLYV